MNELKVTLELSAEDRANLDAIRQLFERTVNQLFERVCAAAEMPEEAPVITTTFPFNALPILLYTSIFRPSYANSTPSGSRKFATQCRPISCDMWVK